jgi:hypothetical protein
MTNRSAASRLVLAIAAATTPLAIGAEPPLRLGWDAAQANGLPQGWKALTFEKISRHTRFTLVSEDGGYLVKAEADASASGLVHPLDLDPRAYRILRWRWKVENVLAKADIGSKQGDDYPVRVYVTFAYDPARASIGQRMRYEAARMLHGEYPPHAGLNYVWDAKAPAGTVVPNAYTDRVRMIVVESGTARLGQWTAYERNVAEDYRRAFGEDPPRISGVAIMTDTDDTGESAVAYYGDISIAAP